MDFKILKKMKLEEKEEDEDKPIEYEIKKHPNEVKLIIKINSILSNPNFCMERAGDISLFCRIGVVIKNHYPRNMWTPDRFAWLHNFLKEFKKSFVKELEIDGGCAWYYYDIGDHLPSTIEKILFKNCSMSKFDIEVILKSISESNLKLSDIVFNTKARGSERNLNISGNILDFIEKNTSILNLKIPYIIDDIDSKLDQNRNIYYIFQEKAKIIKLGHRFDESCNFNLFNFPKSIINLICRYVIS
jgi:hypothetical protein